MNNLLQFSGLNYSLINSYNALSKDTLAALYFKTYPPKEHMESKNIF